MSGRRRRNRYSLSEQRLAAQVDQVPLLDPCPTCGKRRYRTRKAARAALRKLNRPGSMSVYPCGDYWHFGHTPWQVRKGVEPRREWRPAT